MHDERGVRVLHRLEDLHEQRDAGPHVEALLVAMPVEADALDVLDGEERPAALVDTGVVEPRDVGVVERAEDVALALHAHRQVRGPGELRQLERELALELPIGALREPDRPLATAADAFEDAVGADLVAGLQVRRRLGHPGQRVEERPGLDAGLRGQQSLQRTLQRTMFRRQPVEPRLVLRRVEGERLIEEPVDDRPLRRQVGEQFQGSPSVAER